MQDDGKNKKGRLNKTWIFGGLNNSTGGIRCIQCIGRLVNLLIVRCS